MPVSKWLPVVFKFIDEQFQKMKTLVLIKNHLYTDHFGKYWIFALLI